MALLSVFCFWFSVRLGSIIIGILTLFQACTLLMILVVCLQNIEETSKHLKNLLNVFKVSSPLALETAEEPNWVLIQMCLYLTLLISSSVSLIYGAFKIQTKFIYPFLFLFVAYILLVIVGLVAFIFHLKLKESGIGELILYSNISGFVVLFYIYQWSVVLSLVQIISELKRAVVAAQTKVKSFTNTTQSIRKYRSRYTTNVM